MTTIATDGLSMAGDGLRQAYETIVSHSAQKVRRLKDGRIIGTSGDVAFGLELVDWLESGGPKPTLKGDCGFCALVLNSNGTVELIGHECVLMPIAIPAAVGSGMDLAIGAMEAGADAARAVEIASGRDPNTGGVITCLERPTLTVARKAA